MIPDITKKARHAQTQNEHKPARRRPPDNHPAILWALKEDDINGGLILKYTPATNNIYKPRYNNDAESNFKTGASAPPS